MSEVSEILVSPEDVGSAAVPRSNRDTSRSTPTVSKRPKDKARSAWQKAIRTTKSRIDIQRPQSSGRGGRHRSVSPNGKPGAGGGRENREPRECERSRSVTPAEDPVLALQEELKLVTQRYEQTVTIQKDLQTRTEVQVNQNQGLKVDIKEKETVIDRLRRENETKAAIIANIRKELKEATEKVRGVTNMEWKAMEYEKVTIMNENLKQKLDNQISENRELERRLRDREKEIEEKDRRIEITEAKVEELNEKMLDLRLQVREEAIRNTRLDEQVEQLTTAQRLLTEKEEEVETMEKELEDTKLLLQHAKRSWKEERDRIKEYEDCDKQERLKEDEMEFTQSENVTLRRLLLAKDTLLIQKSQTLENIKNLLNQQDNDFIAISTVRHVLQCKPVIKPTFPKGNKAKQELSNGFDGDDGVDGLTSDRKHHSKRGKLLHNLLGDEWLTSALTNGHVSHSSETRAASLRRPKTAVVKPTTYSASSFTNFRSSTNSIDDTNQGFKRWNTSKELRTDRSDSSKTNSSKSQTDRLDSARLRRSKSAENRIHLDESSRSKTTDSPRPSSASTWSQKTMSVSTVGSSGSGSVSAALLKAAPSKDRKYSRIVRTGDRVVVDMGKCKEKRKLDFHSGVIKFIGNLDKEHDCYRIYTGIRLDEPLGDTDGIYKGKRYFKVTANHGKFVRITRIKSVYDKESSKYEDIDVLLRKFEQDQENGQDVVHTGRNFSLDL